MVAGNSADLIAKADRSPFYYPLWLSGKSWPAFTNALSVLITILAIPTSLFQWGIGWALITFVETLLGAFLVAFIPLPIRIILVAIGPFISVIIIGAIWGFWRI